MKVLIEITLYGETKKVKFTEPQACIMKRLLNGDKVTTVNTHRMDGGDFVWYNDSIKEGSYWGFERVGYKAFWGAMLAVGKAFGSTWNEIRDIHNNYANTFMA